MIEGKIARQIREEYDHIPDKEIICYTDKETICYLDKEIILSF